MKKKIIILLIAVGAVAVVLFVPNVREIILAAVEFVRVIGN